MKALLHVYDRIEQVMSFARNPLALHEFREVSDPVIQENALTFLRITEGTLGRRLREMREIGRVTSKRREGKAFVEYALVPKKAVQQEFPAEAVAA